MQHQRSKLTKRTDFHFNLTIRAWAVTHAHLNMNYTEHLRRTEALRYTTYIRRNGQGYRLVNGNLIPEAEFQAANKLPVRCGISLDNPCNKHKFLDV